MSNVHPRQKSAKSSCSKPAPKKPRIDSPEAFKAALDRIYAQAGEAPPAFPLATEAPIESRVYFPPTEQFKHPRKILSHRSNPYMPVEIHFDMVKFDGNVSLLDHCFEASGRYGLFEWGAINTKEGLNARLLQACQFLDALIEVNKRSCKQVPACPVCGEQYESKLHFTSHLYRCASAHHIPFVQSGSGFWFNGRAWTCENR